MYRRLAWIICTICNKEKRTTGQCEPKRNIWNLITSPYPALLCRKAFQFCGDRLPSERTIGALVWGAGSNWGWKVKPRGDNYFKFSPGFENAPLTIDRKYLHSRSCLVHIFHGSCWPLLQMQMHLLRLFSCRALSIGKTKKCSLFCKFVIQIGISPIIKSNLNAWFSLL